MASIEHLAPSPTLPGVPTGSRRRALLGTVLTTFPETLAEVLRHAGRDASDRRPGWRRTSDRRPRPPGPIAGRPLDEPVAPAPDAVALEVQIEADLDAVEGAVDASPRARSIDVDPCGRVRVLSDFVAHVSPIDAARPLWGNLYPAGEAPEAAQAGMSGLLHAAANLTYGDLGQAARIVLAVTDDPGLYAALRGTYQAVLIDGDGLLVEHSIGRPAALAA